MSSNEEGSAAAAAPPDEDQALSTIYRFLLARLNANALKSVESLISSLSTNDAARAIIGSFFHIEADLHRIGLVWKPLLAKYGNALAFELLKLWKKAADLSSTPGTNPQVWTQLVGVFATLVDAALLALFPDISKLKDFFNVIVTLLDLLSTSHKEKLFHSARSQLKTLFRRAPALYDAFVDLLQQNASSTKHTVLIGALVDFGSRGKNRPLLAKTKPLFLDLYDKHVLSARGQVAAALKENFSPLLRSLTDEEFKEKIFASASRQLKRSPDCLDTVLHLVKNVNGVDLNEFAGQFASLVKDYTQSSDETARKHANQVFETVAHHSTKEAVLQGLASTAVDLFVAGSSNWYARHGAARNLFVLAASPSVAKLPGEVRSGLVAKVAHALVKASEKENNKDCLEVNLNAIAKWISHDVTQVSKELVALFLKGGADKDAGKVWLQNLWAAVKDAAFQPTEKFVPEAVGLALVKPLATIVLTAKSKMAVAVEAMLSAAILAVLSSGNPKFDTAVSEEKVWTFVLSPESFLFAPDWVAKLEENYLPALVSLLTLIASHHFAKLEASPVAKQWYTLILQLLQHEKASIRHNITHALTAVHSRSPKLSARLFATFDLDVLPKVVAAAVPPYFDRPMHQRAILAALLATIVSASLPVSEFLTRLVLLAHHPFLVTPINPSLWGRVLKHLNTTNEAIFSVASNVTAVTAVLSAGLRSTADAHRDSAVIATASLLSVTELAPHLLDLVAPLLEPTGWYALSKDELGVLRTPVGKLCKLIQLDEYVPPVATGKKKDEDDFDAQRKAAAARKKHEEMIKEKLARLEAEQTVIEAAMREKAEQVFLPLHSALKVVHHAARENPAAFDLKESAFLYDTMDHIVSLARRRNDLQPLAIRTLESLGSHCIAPRYNKSLVARALTATPVAGVSDEAKKSALVQTLTDAIKSIIDHSPHMEPRSWAVLQPVLASVFTKDFAHETQEKALHEITKRIRYISGPMIECFANVIGNLPAFADQTRAVLLEACKGLSAARPMHHTAIAPLIHHSKFNPVASVRLAALEGLGSAKDLIHFNLNAAVLVALWVARFDEAVENSELGKQLYEKYAELSQSKLTADYYGPLVQVLDSDSASVVGAGARALVGAMLEFPETQVATFEALFKVYKDHHPQQVREDKKIVEAPAVIRARTGVAEVLKATAQLANISSDQLSVVFRFLIDVAIADVNTKVYDKFLEAGIGLLNTLGGTHFSAVHPLLEKYLDASAPQSMTQGRSRQTVVIFLGTLAQHLKPEDPRTMAIVEKLLDVLHTPSEAVQKAIANNLSSIVRNIPGNAEKEKLMRRCLDLCLNSADYGDKRGGAYGLAGLIKGLKPISMHKYSFIMADLEKAASAGDNEKNRQGASLAYECLSLTLGRTFEPWVLKTLPQLLNSFGDSSSEVREITSDAAKAIMSQLTGTGVNVVLPVLLKSLDGQDKRWRMKTGAIELLGSMAFCQPEQLGQCLPTIVPKLSTLLVDAHAQVQKASKEALNAICSTITNPEIRKVVPILLKAMDDVNLHGPAALDTLSSTSFVNRIDAPSLSLIMPVVDKALRDRNTDTKKKATRIAGSMCSLTDPSSLRPYVKILLEQLKAILSDPIPMTRATAAIALGGIVKGMENASDILPWLMDTMKSDAGTVERQGAAQGLAQIIGQAMDLDAFKAQLLPRIVQQCTAAQPNARQGYLSLFIFLPEALGSRIEMVLDIVLPAIVTGLADESEQVRDAAFKGGQSIVQKFGDDDQIDYIIPTLLGSIFDPNWRIRNSSVQLLDELLYKISGAADDFATKDISIMLETRTRARIMAALYTLRADLNAVVRQTAIQVWKSLVANTPKTLRTIMHELMETIIEQLSGDEDKQEVASKTLGEVVEKLGDRVLPEVIPILERELNSLAPSTRVGVCLGFTEVLNSSKSDTIPYFDQLCPAIRRALCDESQIVREAAAGTFDELYKVAGDKAVDQMLPPLLKQMEDPDSQKSELALHGLQQMLTVRSNLILPSIVPKLTTPPLTPFNVRALASIAEVSGPAFYQFMGAIIPILLKRVYGESTDLDAEGKAEVEKAAKRIILCMQGSGLNLLFTDLYKFLRDPNPLMRVGAASQIGVYCQESKTLFTEHIPNLLLNLLKAYSDPYPKLIEATQAALTAVTAAIPKDDTSKSYIGVINDTLDIYSAAEYLPGFNIPNGLQPLLPLYKDTLLSGSQEEREQAAVGLQLMLKMTDNNMLKPYLQQITGALIRILMERSLNTPVRVALLKTLNLVMVKGGIALRVFVSQLQPTYVKALLATSRDVRNLAIEGVTLLLPMGTKADFLIKDLLRTLTDATNPAPEACLLAIAKTMKALTKDQTPQPATIDSLRDSLTPFLENDSEDVRKAGGKAMASTARFAPPGDVSDLVMGYLLKGDQGVESDDDDAAQ